MLYDHGNMLKSEGGDFEPFIPATNASLREPQQSSQRRKATPAQQPTGIAPVELGKRG
jgi:hypothetical protein